MREGCSDLRTCYHLRWRSKVWSKTRTQPHFPAPQLVAQLVAEIILCCKEVNTKTRATAFELLVEVGHAMHAARPPPAMPLLDEAMGTLSVSDGPCCADRACRAVFQSVRAEPHSIWS